MVTQDEAPKVKEVITSGPAIPVEKANAKPASVIPKEEKSISDANSLIWLSGIGSSAEVTGIIDTGVAVNLMIFETYEDLNLRGLEPRKCFVTMANSTRSRCMGVVEDVPVNLGGNVVMADFVVVESPQVKTKEMHKDMLLLGRPFINSTRMIVDLHGRKCSIQVHGKERILQAAATPYYLVQVNTRNYVAAHTSPLYTYSRSRVSGRT